MKVSLRREIGFLHSMSRMTGRCEENKSLIVVHLLAKAMLDRKKSMTDLLFPLI